MDLPNPKDGADGKEALVYTKTILYASDITSSISFTLKVANFNRTPVVGETFNAITVGGYFLIPEVVQVGLDGDPDSVSCNCNTYVKLVGPQGPQGPVGEGINNLTSFNLSVGDETVTYDTTNGITVNTTGKMVYGTANNEVAFTSEYQLPIVAGDGISIAANDTGDKAEVKASLPITVPWSVETPIDLIKSKSPFGTKPPQFSILTGMAGGTIKCGNLFGVMGANKYTIETVTALPESPESDHIYFITEA